MPELPPSPSMFNPAIQARRAFRDPKQWAVLQALMGAKSQGLGTGPEEPVNIPAGPVDPRAGKSLTQLLIEYFQNQPKHVMIAPYPKGWTPNQK